MWIDEKTTDDDEKSRKSQEDAGRPSYCFQVIPNRAS
jgi:hypothetical protein